MVIAVMIWSHIQMYVEGSKIMFKSSTHAYKTREGSYCMGGETPKASLRMQRFLQISPCVHARTLHRAIIGLLHCRVCGLKGGLKLTQFTVIIITVNWVLSTHISIIGTSCNSQHCMHACSAWGYNYIAYYYIYTCYIALCCLEWMDETNSICCFTIIIP